MMNTTKTTPPAPPPAGNALRAGTSTDSERRGSVLILVVGVLVLLAISATVYMGVGRMERLAAAAQESDATRSEVVNKVVEYIGRTLAVDLFGNNDSGAYPFEEYPYERNNLRLGNRTFYENWDYPYTRDESESVDYRDGAFNILADPWLASIEPVWYEEDGVWAYPHLSNIHPQGRFVDLARLFSENLGIYANVTFGGTNPPLPHELDTYTFSGVGNPAVNLEFVQMDDIYDEVNGDNGYITLADRRYGTDTDLDGYLDARWQELPDVYGMPRGMRVFVGTRIIDASAMLNVNSHIELGLSRDSPNGYDDATGFGVGPVDVDLYSTLLETYQKQGDDLWNRPLDEKEFIRNGFSEHLLWRGLLDRQSPPGRDYNYAQRLTRDDRTSFYEDFLYYPYRANDYVRLYGIEDEIELRRFFATSNDRQTSPLEMYFDLLNDSGDLFESHSPLRNNFPNEVNFIDNYPRVEESVSVSNDEAYVSILDDIRHLLTTLNGSVPTRSWSGFGSGGDSVRLKSDINTMLLQPASSLREVTGALMWALAPFAIDRDPNGTPGTPSNIYGIDVEWQPTGTRQLHYGNGNAGFAFARAAMLTVNARDALDDNDIPSAFTLFFNDDYSNRFNGNATREIIGDFDWGQIPVDNLNGFNGDQRGKKITMIGLERQPFFREVVMLNIFKDSDIDGDYSFDPYGNPSDWYLKLLAFEIENPWDTDIDIKSCVIEYAGNRFGFLPDSPVILDAGQTVILYATDGSIGGIGGNHDALVKWRTLVTARNAMGGTDIRRLDILGGVEINLGSGDVNDDTVLLWRVAEYGGFGGSRPRVLIDRIEPSPTDPDKESFPNLFDSSPGDSRYVVFDGEDEGAWLIKVGSMRRYCGKAGGGLAGFPGSILQIPSSISSQGMSGESQVYRDPLYADPAPMNTLVVESNMSDKLNEPSDNKGYGSPPVFAAFQFHVPNLESGNYELDAFRSPADLLTMTSVTHINFNNPTDMGAVVDLTHSREYITVSEFLGDERLADTVEARLQNAGDLSYDRIIVEDILRAPSLANPGEFYMPDFRLSGNRLSGSIPNRFVGKLDYTRYIPRDNNSALSWEAIPSALRIVDAFETGYVDIETPLMQGKININTAPARVLRALPYLYPRYQAGDLPAGEAGALRFAEAIVAYRDGGRFPDQGGPSLDWFDRGEASNIFVTPGNNTTDGLRQKEADLTGEAGFVSIGELALLGRWGSTGNTYEPDPTGMFARQSLTYLGQDNTNLSKAFEPLNPYYNDEAGTDPMDDVAEWLSLLSVIQNSISVRSDVYIAYINVMGVTPTDLANAERNALGNRSIDKLIALRPTLDQRYMVVFDRSNVKSPSDRPRILFAVQEASNR